MKRTASTAILTIAATLMVLLVQPKQLVASPASNYELTLCKMYFPDGTFHLGAQCTFPNPNGPCDKVAVCSGGAPPPNQ